jgi:hypothetical protein
MQNLKEYTEELIESNDRLRKANKSSNPYSDIKQHLDMFEDIVLRLADEIDSLKSKIK